MCVEEGKSPVFSGLTAAQGATGTGRLGRGCAQEMACLGGVSRCHCGIAATTADVTGVGEETKCWLQRVVEGTLWCPRFFQKKSWESFGEA